MHFSIVNYQSVVGSSLSTRIDADFFHPNYLKTQNFLESMGSQKLVNLQVTIKHPKEITRNYVKDGTMFLRAQNVRPMSIDTDANTVFISAKDAEMLKDNALQYKDILLTRTGANFGQCAIYLEDCVAIASSHTFIIRSGHLNPFFLVVFLNTKYGRTLIDKGKYGSSQPEVAPYFLYQIPIPIMEDLQAEIENTYLQAHELAQSSKAIYTQAQQRLLSELNLADWQPKPQTESVRNFSDVWGAGRIDAEYYQPKYDDIVDAIKGYAGGWDTLGNLAAMRKCVEVGSKQYLDEGIPFVRVSNVTPFEITEEKYISEELYSQVAQHQPQQGEILLSKDATPGIAHYLDEQPGKMIPAGGILRLKRKSDKVNDEYLTLALNSMLTQEQVNRDVGGSVIMHWRPDQVSETLIPILPKDKQAEIRRKVAESASLRRQSRALLERAKQAVEIAIEDGEAAAMEWLEARTQEG